MFKTMFFVSMAFVASFLFRNAIFKLGSDQTVDEEVKVSKRKIREPASVKLKNPDKPSEMFRPGMSQSERRPTDFSAPVNDFPSTEAIENAAPVVEDTYAGGVPYSPEASSDYRPQNRPSDSTSSSKGSSGKNGGTGDKKVSAGRAGALGPFPGGNFPFVPPAVKPKEEIVDTSNDDDEPSSSSSLSCSSNVGSGAYSNPIAVGLTCTSSADIKYCLNEGSCCDPTSAGLPFTSNVVVGSSDGTYCLSYYGTSAAGMSVVVQQNFTIASTLPHLESTHDQIYYQTTELSGTTHIASDDFGKMSFGVGVLNLKSNDPGPSGGNFDCDEIVTNYVSFPAPVPVEVMSFFDTSMTPATSQLDVPLRIDHLDYGENFITTYMTDNRNAAPVYSCATSKVQLEDFDYFQADASHGETGTNAVREFSGGFSAYGFFEEEATVYRGPAGLSSEDAGGEKLETGLFGVFY